MNNPVTRKLAGIAIVAASFLGAGALTGAPAANAAISGPSLDCRSDALSPPYQTNVATVEDFVYTTDGRKSFQNLYTWTANTSIWKYANNQWYPSDWSGADTAVDVAYPNSVEAWAYTWYYYNNQYHPQGWTYLGSCLGEAF